MCLFSMEIDLKQSSWEVIIKVIQQSNIKSEGNFWAAIQSIESQLSELSYVTKSKYKVVSRV